MEKAKYFIIEFMEDMFSDWSYHEFTQMYKYLCRSSGNILILTNFQIIKNFKDEESQENLKQLYEFINQEHAEIFWLAEKTLFDYYDPKTNAISIEVFVSTENCKNSNKFSVPLERVCLLDMRGEGVLNPADKSIFDAYLFGGILGDNPPRDRTCSLRERFTKRRRLHKMQMSTDSAVLVTDMIINGGFELDKIPFLENPELQNPEDPSNSVALEGFAYVSNKYDVATGKIVTPAKEEPIINEFIKNTLIFIDFDFDII